MFALPGILLPEIVLLVAGILLLAGGSTARNRRLWTSLSFATLILTASCLSLSPPAPLASGSLILCDLLGVSIQWLLLGLGLLLVLAVATSEKNAARLSIFCGGLMLTLAGAMTLVVANDLIVILIAMELLAGGTTATLVFTDGLNLASVSAAIRRPGSNVGVQYATISLFATTLLLLGFCILAGLTGTTDLTAIRGVFASVARPNQMDGSIPPADSLGIFAFVVILGSVGFRAGLIPFDLLTVRFLDASQPIRAAMVIVVHRIAAFVVLTRVLVVAMVGYGHVGQVAAFVVAVATMFVSGILAFRERRVTRLCTYLASACCGFILIGTAATFVSTGTLADTSAGSSLPGWPAPVSVMVLGLYAYGIAVVGFLAVHVYVDQPDGDIRFVDQFAGLARSEPLAAIAAVTCLLSLIGLPPLLGFWNCVFVFASALSVDVETPRALVLWPSSLFLSLSIAGWVAFGILVAVVARLARILVLDEPIARPRPSGGQGPLAVALLATLILIGLGLLPAPFLDYLATIRLPLPQ